jgi:phycobilisome core-membrane linker protein
MSVKASGGSPVAHPQTYQTVPTAVISCAQQHDRFLKASEAGELMSFFQSGAKRLEIAAILTERADAIVAAGANRIFVGGSPMAYLEKPQDPVGMPGSGYYVGEDYLTAARRNGMNPEQDRATRKLQNPSAVVDAPRVPDLFGNWLELLGALFSDRDPLPGGFRHININRYGPVRMKRSMRDLAWFLRYITYAIVAGDTSILSVNVRGLRGVIPEDVTEATVVALKEMRWKSLTFFKEDDEATALIEHCFTVLINEYLADKPARQLRIGVSRHQQGLQLPQSYALAAETRPKFVMKPGSSETQKQEVIKAAYRQVFERDITKISGFAAAELESRVKSGEFSMKEFIRALGKSKLYRRLFYEPFVISRAIELAMRHFLGRGLSSREEFQTYFAIVSQRGFPALVDALVDSREYADYFGEETVPYLRGLGQEAQECRNWGPQLDLLKYSAPTRKVPQFVTLFASSQKALPNQHPYGTSNDPLEIQFGAIFPRESTRPTPQTIPFGRDYRRILIHSGSGQENGKALGSRAFKLSPLGHTNGMTNGVPSQGPSITLSHHSPDAVIHAAYRQVFGRELLEGQRAITAEVKLRGGEIRVREFIRQIAKSKAFRRLYWEKLYVTKAIEYIHRRLLGRPTYGRSELNRYYDICARKGFYGLIDELVDSDEYWATFGDDTVPYERYLTPRGFAMRSLRQPVAWSRSEAEAPPPDNHNGRRQAATTELAGWNPPTATAADRGLALSGVEGSKVEGSKVEGNNQDVTPYSETPVTVATSEESHEPG